MKPEVLKSYKLLLLGHRSLIKKITQTAVITLYSNAFLKNLTFRMLVHIHFQKFSKIVTVTFENVCGLAYETSSSLKMRWNTMFITAVCVIFLKSWSLEIDYSRAPCLGADQKARGLWERDWLTQFINSIFNPNFVVGFQQIRMRIVTMRPTGLDSEPYIKISSQGQKIHNERKRLEI